MISSRELVYSQMALNISGQASKYPLSSESKFGGREADKAAP